MLTPNKATGLIMFILLYTGFHCPPKRSRPVTSFGLKLKGYYSFNPNLRLGVLASRSTDGASYNSIEVGSTLNFFAKRFVRPVLVTPNEAQNHSLVFGVGYRYIAGIDQSPENRIELDFAPQIPLAAAYPGERSQSN